MQDDEVIAYWDEMNAPLGMGRAAEPAPRRRRVWLAFPALAALAGALVGAAPAAWRMVSVPGPVAAPSSEGPFPPVARSVEAAPPEAPTETARLRPTPPSEAVRQLPPPPGRPNETESGGNSAPEAETGRSRAVIINVAEALAAAKLKGAPR